MKLRPILMWEVSPSFWMLANIRHSHGPIVMHTAANLIHPNLSQQHEEISYVIMVTLFLVEQRFLGTYGFKQTASLFIYHLLVIGFGQNKVKRELETSSHSQQFSKPAENFWNVNAKKIRDVCPVKATFFLRFTEKLPEEKRKKRSPCCLQILKKTFGLISESY